jgi:phage replication-related protein YjqB (UPF0714/DUF867 family)
MNHKTYDTPSPDSTHHISRRRFGAGVAGLASVAAFAGLPQKSALAANEVQAVPLPLMIPIEVTSTLNSQDLDNKKWLCSVSADLAPHFDVGSHIRVRRNVDNYAVYTVAEVRDQDPPKTVRMCKAARQRVGTSNSFQGLLLQSLATKLMTDAQAENAGEFVERIADSPNNQGLVLMAPHGGEIESKSDFQVKRAAEVLAGKDVSTWCCMGWRTAGNPYDRWHVSSSIMTPTSFPGLATIADRGFAYAVTFHGMKADGVLIGGAGPQELKQMLRQAIKSVLGNHPVSIAEPNGHNSGASAGNLVNWITAGGGGGIQLEQSKAVRNDYWSDVAEAVAEVYAELI